jgi:Fe-S-cluster containining protein
MNTKNKWWKDGIRFQCQGSGKCCASRGEYGYVYLTKEDRQRMATHLGLKVRAFISKYCNKTDGYFHFKGSDENSACLFLKDKQCGVYEARPTQCRTWPFWPDVMGAKAWKRDVVDFCPGINKGPIIPAEEIMRQLEIQKKSEDA